MSAVCLTGRRRQPAAIGMPDGPEVTSSSKKNIALPQTGLCGNCAWERSNFVASYHLNCSIWQKIFIASAGYFGQEFFEITCLMADKGGGQHADHGRGSGSRLLSGCRCTGPGGQL